MYVVPFIFDLDASPLCICTLRCTMITQATTCMALKFDGHMALKPLDTFVFRDDVVGTPVVCGSVRLHVVLSLDASMVWMGC